MYVKALNKFNHGGIVSMEYSESRNIDDAIAEKLIKLGLVVEIKPSYKTIKIKGDAKPIDKADNQESE